MRSADLVRRARDVPQRSKGPEPGRRSTFARDGAVATTADGRAPTAIGFGRRAASARRPPSLLSRGDRARALRAQPDAAAGEPKHCPRRMSSKRARMLAQYDAWPPKEAKARTMFLRPGGLLAVSVEWDCRRVRRLRQRSGETRPVATKPMSAWWRNTCAATIATRAGGPTSLPNAGDGGRSNRRRAHQVTLRVSTTGTDADWM